MKHIKFGTACECLLLPVQQPVVENDDNDNSESEASDDDGDNMECDNMRCLFELSWLCLTFPSSEQASLNQE